MRHSIYSIFFDQVLEHERHERYDQAIALLYQVHRWAPQDPDLWRRLGVLSYLMTDREWLTRLDKLESHLADMGAVNAALYLEKAEALAPGDARFPFWVGWVRHALYQDFVGAREALGRALAIEPQHPYALAALARLEAAERSPGYAERAIAYLTPASERLPESARFHYDMGACLAGLGREDEARAAFRRAAACPRFAPGEDAEGAYLARTFHADGPQVLALVERLYPGLVP